MCQRRARLYAAAIVGPRILCGLRITLAIAAANVLPLGGDVSSYRR
ncbi:hypothetical protein K2Z83_25620 [Oscillochloris sp. ZM17-4]|nr:hypothetical protein [Oscillochloris sp. ZM17-4]MBX0331036.1 hypothetical protein [Oscillochloris sp. ZM17-4]